MLLFLDVFFYYYLLVDICGFHVDRLNQGSGLSSSAKFLEHFTEGYPWAHLDIASMVWSDTDKGAESPKGATGYGVRLLVELAGAI